MNVIVSLDYNPLTLREDRIKAICGFALQKSGAPEMSEVSISFIDNEEMASMNEHYRGKEGPTDVLSFECDNLDDSFPSAEGDQAVILGDILIAPDVAAAQAEQYGTDPQSEIDLLCVHGILHLQGYDHVLDEDAAEMEELQKRILDMWKSGEGGDA